MTSILLARWNGAWALGLFFLFSTAHGFQNSGAALQSPSAPAAARKAGTLSDELFKQPTVVSLEINIPRDSVAALQRQDREYVKATVREGNVTYSEVGIHLKGMNGSKRPLQDKPALTIKFDKFKEGQRFHGLKKIHLNNAVQDSSYFCEIICAELFLQAGVPATRATPARLRLDGRDLGLYVLKEGFDKTFLRRHFRDQDGNLYDTAYRLDINQRLTAITGEDPNGDKMLQAATAASQIPDAQQRLEALRKAVDLDRFISFMAMESITVHWDGYSMFKNNYRVYADPSSKRLVFFPHGMDMMFQRPECSLLPAWDGLIARGIMETPEGKQLYLSRVGALFTNVFSAQKLTNRIQQLHAAVRPALRDHNPNAAQAHDQAVQSLMRQIVQRAENLKQQLANPEAFATGEHPVIPGMVRRSRPPAVNLPGPRAGAPSGTPILVRNSRPIMLPITSALLRGTQIRLEGQPEAPNAGSWLDASDYVEWTLVVTEAGAFNIELTYASAQGTGGPFEVVVGDQRIKTKTRSTGGYQNYENLSVGTLTLVPGRTKLTVKPGGDFVFGLMNLRSVKLTPAQQ
jgi:spore coat protein H